jgi:fluoride ion exporter CrcB/FEX
MWKPILVISLGWALGALLRWVLGTKLFYVKSIVEFGTLGEDEQ